MNRECIPRPDIICPPELWTAALPLLAAHNMKFVLRPQQPIFHTKLLGHS